MYIVVRSVSPDKSYYSCVLIDNNFNVVGLQNVASNMLPGFVVSNGYKPINFSIESDGSINGKWHRLQADKCAVVLAAVKSPGGRTLGYRLLSLANGSVTNMKIADIVAYAKNLPHPFLQNAIIRNETINNYPGEKFPVLTIQAPAKAPKPIATPKAPVVNKRVETTKERDDRLYSPEAIAAANAEIAKCKKHGINADFLLRGNLDSKQMRVLWVSKSKGAYAEAFNNPDLSVDAMKFYADRICSKAAAKECKVLLDHPELSVEELTELYQCINEGIDPTELIGESPVNIQIAREKATRQYWGATSILGDDTDYYSKAVRVAMNIRSGR